MELRQRYRGSSDTVWSSTSYDRSETETAAHFLAAGWRLLAKEPTRMRSKNTNWGFSPNLRTRNSSRHGKRLWAARSCAPLYRGAACKGGRNYDLAETLYQKAGSFDTPERGPGRRS